MKDEIKEILDKMNDLSWYEVKDTTGTKWIELKLDDTDKLVHYITNLQSKTEKIEKILNDKRAIMLQQMFSGNVDYEELLFQIDEEIREVLKDSDK